MIQHYDDHARRDENQQLNEERTVLGAILSTVRLSPHQVEEMSQEMWLRIWRDLPLQLWDEDQTRGRRRWIARVARNLTVDLIRDLHRLPTQPLDVPRTDMRDRHGEEAATQAQRERLLDWLRDALEDLRRADPVGHRLLYGEYFENRSVAELAAATGLSENAVRCRNYRTRQKLRERGSEIRDDN